jgi:hypothetical protein
MPVSQVEGLNNAISQIASATGKIETAQAQLPHSQTFGHASSSRVQTQSIQLNDQNQNPYPSYNTATNQGMYL